MEAKDSSASKSTLEKPPNTPEMSAQDAEAMANAMLLDSPLPNSERGNEEVLEDGGSNKLPVEGEGMKHPEGGGKDQPEETPTGKLVPPCKKDIFLLLLI